MEKREVVKILQYVKRCMGMSDQGSAWKANAETIAIDIAIGALEIETPAWVPVSERIPGRYEAVLVTAKMEIEEEPLVYEGVLGTGWELCGVKNSKDYIVSAWMPLPEPYSPY